MVNRFITIFTYPAIRREQLPGVRMLRAASNKHPTWLLLKLSFGVATGEVSYGLIYQMVAKYV